jgi:hypothetical protein
MKYTHALYRTSFHGGGLISHHRSLEAAERAQRRWSGDTDCVCGCAVIVELPANLPTQDQHNWSGTKSPYVPTEG